MFELRASDLLWPSLHRSELFYAAHQQNEINYLSPVEKLVKGESLLSRVNEPFM